MNKEINLEDWLGDSQLGTDIINKKFYNKMRRLWTGPKGFQVEIRM